MVGRVQHQRPGRGEQPGAAAAGDRDRAVRPGRACFRPTRSCDLDEILSGRFTQPIELFPFLMILLLLVLAGENLLANKFYRRKRAAR